MSSESVDERLAGLADATEARDLVDQLLFAETKRSLFNRDSPTQRVGRFELVRCLGSGGMGSVFVAHDPKLDRTVALKMIHIDAPRERKRILSEARALARLQHQNIVTVHEVEVEDANVYMAMEFIDGVRLSSHMSTALDWRGVVRIFVQVAEGLEAAHQAEVVHGDIKPANIMVSENGRVCLVDFGLSQVGESDVDSFGGTPGYIAPEKRSTAKSDIYAMCISLQTCLDDRHAPKRLSRLIERGLLDDPNSRPNAAEFHLELSKLLTRRRRRQIAFAMVLVLTILGGLLWSLQHKEEHAQPVVACKQHAAHLEETWRVAEPKVQANLVDAKWANAPVLISSLNHYANEYRQLREESCSAYEQGLQSADLFDRSQLCFQRRATHFETLVEEVVAANSKQPKGALLLKRSAIAAQRLPLLDDCRDPQYLLSGLALPRDNETREQIKALYKEVTHSEGLLQLGLYKQGAASIGEIVDKTQQLDWQPLIAEALILEYRYNSAKDRKKDVIASLEAAAVAASLGKGDRLLAKIWIAAMVGAANLSDFERATEYSERAKLALGRIERPKDIEAELLYSQAVLAQKQGHYADALSYAEMSLENRIGRLGEDHYQIAAAHKLVGTIHLDLGAPKTALPHLLSAERILEKTLGKKHPVTAHAYHGLADVLSDLGQVRQAEQYYLQTLATQEREYGPVHLGVAITLGSLGSLYLRMHKIEDARPILQRSFEIKKTLTGDESPSLAFAYMQLGSLALDDKKYTEAEQHFRSALAIRTKSVAPRSVPTAKARVEIATALNYQLKYEQAVVEYRLAHQIYLEKLGPANPQVALPWLSLARSLQAQGQCTKALPWYERAHSIWTDQDAVSGLPQLEALLGLAECHSHDNDLPLAASFAGRALVLSESMPEDKSMLARARFAVAQSNPESASSISLAQLAHEFYQQESHHQSSLQEVEDWLTQHE